MNESLIHDRVSPILVIRWLARITSLASISMLLLFALGGEESLQFNNSREVLGFTFFPIGIVAGMIVGWKWELTGGLVSILSLIGFYIWQFMPAGEIPAGPWFMIFTSPAVLFLVAGLTELVSSKANR